MKDKNSNSNTSGKDSMNKSAPATPAYGSTVKPFAGGNTDSKSGQYSGSSSSSGQGIKKDSADSSKNSSWKSSDRK